jgi:uncharacterized protein
MPRSDVKFDSAGLQIAGHLYMPENPAPGPHPAVVVGHPTPAGVSGMAIGLYTWCGKPPAGPAPMTRRL